MLISRWCWCCDSIMACPLSLAGCFWMLLQNCSNGAATECVADQRSLSRQPLWSLADNSEVQGHCGENTSAPVEAAAERLARSRWMMCSCVRHTTHRSACPPATDCGLPSLQAVDTRALDSKNITLSFKHNIFQPPPRNGVVLQTSCANNSVTKGNCNGESRNHTLPRLVDLPFTQVFIHSLNRTTHTPRLPTTRHADTQKHPAARGSSTRGGSLRPAGPGMGRAACGGLPRRRAA